MKDIYYIIIMVFIVLSLSFTGGILSILINDHYDIIENIFYKHKDLNVEILNNNTTENIINDCEDFTRIDKRLECVQEHINRFYHYKVRADDENITINELIENGGDCANWAYFWNYIATEYNYETEYLHTKIDTKTGHRFLLISNYQGYCIADQIKLTCFIYS